MRKAIQTQDTWPEIKVPSAEWRELELSANQWVHIITPAGVFYGKGTETTIKYPAYASAISRKLTDSEKILVTKFQSAEYKIRPWKIKLPNANSVLIGYQIDQTLRKNVVDAVLNVKTTFKIRISSYSLNHIWLEQDVQLKFLNSAD